MHYLNHSNFEYKVAVDISLYNNQALSYNILWFMIRNNAMMLLGS